MSEAEISQQLILQRMRNRQIETLELAASFEEQRQHQDEAQISVPSEVINQWGDWYWPQNTYGESPVFSQEEIEALRAYDTVLNSICDRLPEWLPEIDVVQTWPEWHELREAASKALVAFEARGRFSEDCEEVFV